jgi:cytochrome c-type biogenesis protein CcmH/NrfF
MRSGPLRKILILIVLMASALPAAASKGAAPAGVDRDELVFAAGEILCDCGCHPQSVYDCACGRSDEMWTMLGDLVARTGSGEAALAAYVEENGDKVLLAPKAEGFNLFAWLGPLAGLLLAVVAVILILRRWKGNQDEETDLGTELDTKLDAGYLSRLNQDLEKMQ